MIKYIIASFILLFCFCNPTFNKEGNKDSIQIVNLAVDKTLGSDTIWRHHKLPLMPRMRISNKDSAEFRRFIKWRDSLKNVLDTAWLFVKVDNTIESVSAQQIAPLIQSISSDSSLENDSKIDTSFIEILKELCNSKKSFDTMQIENVRSRFKYKFYFTEFPFTDNIRQVGSISFSKIAYNKARSKAVVYTSFVCGTTCGRGCILFFEKNKSKWNYVNLWQTWVS